MSDFTEVSLDSSAHYELTNAYAGINAPLNVDSSGSNTLFADSTGSALAWQFTVAPNASEYNICTTYGDATLCLDIDGSDKTKPVLATPGFFSGQQWTISPWGDGTFYLRNDFSGPDLLLDTYSNTLGAFLETANHLGQHWSFDEIPLATMTGGTSTSIVITNTPIDTATQIPTETATPIPSDTTDSPTTVTMSSSASNTQLSTTAIAKSSSSGSSGTTTATVAGSTASSSPVAHASSTSPLSTGAKIGIGVGAGGVVIALLALLAFFFVRKKSRRNNMTPEVPLPMQNHQHAPPVFQHDDAIKYGAPGVVSELPSPGYSGYPSSSPSPGLTYAVQPYPSHPAYEMPAGQIGGYNNTSGRAEL